MKLIVIGIFFVACLFNNLEVESSAQNYVRSPSGWIPAPKSILVKPRPQLSGIERFYGTRGTRGCPRRKILKFIYSEKATKFFEIFTLLLSYVVPVKSKVEISQNSVAFSECMNFTEQN